MIPRFIVRNITVSTIMVLEGMGYSCRENPVPEDVLLIGTSILYAPVAAKNPLIVNFDESKANGNGVIIKQAKLHLKWNKEMPLSIELEKAKVQVNKFGVLIDSFVVSIATFLELAAIFKQELVAPYPFIASHKPVPAKGDKLTIGCADYSLVDFNKIMAAYNSLFN